MQTAFNASPEAILIRLLIQMSVILIAARAVGALFQHMRQSRCIGEMFAGILLGPSLFGWLAPATFQRLFPIDGPPLLPFFSQIGLVFTLFLIGMEFDYSEIPRHGGQVLAIALSTLLLPLAVGAGLSPLLWRTAPGQGSFAAYALFVGLTLAVTAIPVMGRILIELRLTKTKVGILAMTTGAVKDLFTWFVLTLAVGAARSPVELGKAARVLLLAGGLAGLALTLGRKVLSWAERALPDQNGKPNLDLLAGLLIAMLLLSAATVWIGIFAVFGAFLAGAVLSGRRRLAEGVSDRLHDMTVLFFLPIFFTYTGLRADMTHMSATLWLWVAALTAASTAANSIPAYLLSRLEGMARRDSASLAVLINTPGLMDLIIINLGLDLRIIPPELFSVLVATALLRNLITAPVLRRLALDGPKVLLGRFTLGSKAEAVPSR